MAVKNRRKTKTELKAVNDLSEQSEKLANKLADRTYGDNSVSTEIKKRLGIDLNESDYKAFFLKARIEDTDMSTLVRGWIKDYIS